MRNSPRGERGSGNNKSDFDPGGKDGPPAVPELDPSDNFSDGPRPGTRGPHGRNDKGTRPNGSVPFSPSPGGPSGQDPIDDKNPRGACLPGCLRSGGGGRDPDPDWTSGANRKP